MKGTEKGFETLAEFDGAVHFTDKLIKSRKEEIDLEDKDEGENYELVEIEYSREYYESLIKGCDISCLNSQDDNSLTSLHIAASLNNKAMVQFYIEVGIDVGIVSNRGVKALDLARFNSHDEIAEMIGEKLVSLIEAPPSTRVRSSTIGFSEEKINAGYCVGIR